MADGNTMNIMQYKPRYLAGAMERVIISNCSVPNEILYTRLNGTFH